MTDNKDTGITYINQRDPEPFIMAPREMVEFDAERPLGTTARLVRLYLHDLSGRPNWTIYVSQIQRALGISEVTWRTARKELEKQGFYRAERSRAAGGKWEWLHFAFRDPIAPEDPTIPHFPVDGHATHGESIHGQVRDKRSNTSHNKTKQCSSTARARDPAAVAAASDQQQAPTKTRRQRASGIVCWTPDDPAAAAGIEAQATPSEVLAAVAMLAATGKEPVPGRVARAIQNARAERLAAELAAARAEAGPLAAEKRRAAERARRAPDPAQQQGANEVIQAIAARLGVRLDG